MRSVASFSGHVIPRPPGSLLDGNLILYLAGVPVLGIFAQWLAWRLRIPSILLLLGIGVALGTLVKPDEVGFDAQLLFPIVSLSVAVILFEGGMTLHFGELKQAAGNTVLRLCTIGAVVSWVLTGVAACYLLHLDYRIAALIGAVLVVTGPTVVAPMLRQIQPTKRISSIVKWEGIVIDPIGAVAAVLVFEVTFAHEHALLLLVKAIAIGVALGLVSAMLLVQCVRRYWIPDYLHGVVFLATGVGVFVLSNLLQSESGLVTVTILGIALANQKNAPMHHVLEFKEHLRVLLISCLFIVLGSRVDPMDIFNLGWRGLLFLVVMILVVRPASVFVATLATKLSWQERTFLAFLAPRGIVAAAVASVFALELAAHASEAELVSQIESLVPVTFLVIVGTVFFYGLFSAPLARKLGVAEPNPQGILFAGAEPWIREIAKAVMESGHHVVLVDTNYANVAAARMEGLTAECASILGEHARADIDLAGIGRLAAMTPNDEVNSMAAREFLHHFGRADVYQLAPWDAGSRRASISEHLQGRLLFGKGLHHDALVRIFDQGATVKRTKLTEEFSFDDFRATYNEDVILLFVDDENHKLQVCTTEGELKPKAGQTIIALVDAYFDQVAPKANAETKDETS